MDIVETVITNEMFTCRISSINSILGQWSSDIDLAKFDSRFYTRRRSSTDRRILEEWKTLADELKTREHWPWAIQKLIIRRHLRRHRHASESRSVF